MKLERIMADNFLRLNLFDVDMRNDNVVHLFAGNNEAGKSSVQEAIRFAILGETVRVSRKTDYKLMIRDGAKSGTVGILLDGIAIERDIKTGKEKTEATANLPAALEYVLDSQHFAGLNQDKRRAFLINLTGTNVKATDIKRRMLAKGVVEEYIDMVIPMLRSGFTATHKEAQNRASEARSKWVGLTGNARYGSQIAAEWKAMKPEDFDADRLKELEGEKDELQRKVSNLHTDKGGVNSALDMARNKYSCACSECGALLKITTDRDPGTGKIKQTSEPYEDADDVDTGKLQSKLIDINDSLAKAGIRLTEIESELSGLRAKEILFKDSEAITERAQTFHNNVQGWEKAVEALAPDGIPAEILSDTLKPVNDRLRNTSLHTGWPQVVIDPTIEIMVDGRRYSLLSESARWRADVAIADAIAYLSDIRLMVIDRMDVLDLQSRGSFLKWINAVKDNYDSILIFATLKNKPALPGGMESHWIVNGEILETEEEAAA